MKKIKWQVLLLFGLLILPMQVRAGGTVYTAIVNVTEPVHCQQPDMKAVPYYNYYTAKVSQWYKCSGTTMASCTGIIDAPSTFMAGQNYGAYVYLGATPEYAFVTPPAGTPVAQVNGVNAYLVSSDASYMRVMRIFTAKDGYCFSVTPATDYTFPAQTEGYTTTPTYNFTVQNNSSQNITISANRYGSVAAFNLKTALPGNPVTGINLGVNGKVTYTINPVLDLSPGTYSLKITIVGTNAPSKVINFSFTVKPKTAPPATTFSITVDNGKANKDKAKEGETVIITANPAPEGKIFDKWVTTNAITFAEPNNYSTSFQMIGQNVKVTATYKELPEGEFAINVKNNGNGIAYANHLSAKAGEIITLTERADRGYHFVKWKVITGKITIKNNEFIMPGEAVTVEAIFAKDGIKSEEKNTWWLWIIFSIFVLIAIGSLIWLFISNKKNKGTKKSKKGKKNNQK